MGQTNRFLVMLVALLATAAVHAQQSAPRLTAASVRYLGAFAVPNGPGGPPSTTSSRAAFGGGALSVETEAGSGRKLLIMAGHVYNPGFFAKVSIPQSLVKSRSWSDLPLAQIVVDFSDVFDGKLATAGDMSNGVSVGTLVWNGRLVIGAAANYANDSDQRASLGASGLDFSVPNDFTGFVPLFTQYNQNSATSQRIMGGYMTPIPLEWRSLLGGPAIGGNCCLSVISANSAGPAASVFDPDAVGRGDHVSGTTLLAYPSGQPVCSMTRIAGCMDGNGVANEVFNLTTRVAGIAFPKNTRSVLFIGRHGVGPYCYDQPDQPCADPMFAGNKGTHAPPYRYQVWAYDANDLLLVKNGRKQPWEIFPYSYWELPEIGQLLASQPVNMNGATFDPDTNRLYVATAYGENPRIEVFEIVTAVAPSAPQGFSVH